MRIGGFQRFDLPIQPWRHLLRIVENNVQRDLPVTANFESVRKQHCCCPLKTSVKVGFWFRWKNCKNYPKEIVSKNDGYPYGYECWISNPHNSNSDNGTNGETFMKQLVYVLNITGTTPNGTVSWTEVVDPSKHGKCHWKTLHSFQHSRQVFATFLRLFFSQSH